MNDLPGRITLIERLPPFHRVTVIAGETRFVVLTLELGEIFSEGRPVRLIFKESDVVLAKNGGGLISVENAVPCVVSALKTGEVLAEVHLEGPAGRMYALVSRCAKEGMALALNDRVTAFVPSTEIALAGLEEGKERVP